MPRIMAIDYGERRVGLAVSDETGTLAARPLETVDRKRLPRSRKLEEFLAGIAEDQQVEEIVVGLPVNMDGTHGEMARAAIELADRLREVTGLEVHTWDERLTSVVAGKVQREIGLPRGKRRQKSRLDRAAALLMLQNYLNYRSRMDA